MDTLTIIMLMLVPVVLMLAFFGGDENDYGE